MLPTLLDLGWKDARQEWPSSLSMIVAIASVILPIIILLSLKAGIVGQMRAELDQSIKGRELISVNEPRVTDAVIEQLRADERVAFIAPKTRLLSASALLSKTDGEPNLEVDLIPTGSGDPARQKPMAKNTVALSEAAARELEVGEGEKLELIIDRYAPDNSYEILRFPLRVAEVVPFTTTGDTQMRAYMPVRFVVATEEWKQNPDVTSFKDISLSSKETREAGDPGRTYAGLRMYARSINDVIELRNTLIQLGIDTDSRSDQIGIVQRLERSMNLAIGLLSGLMAIGLVMALGAIQWGWVERKKFDYSYLRLLGLAPQHLAALPIMQALLFCASGLGLAVLCAAALQSPINALFAGRVGGLAKVSQLLPGDILLVVGLAFLVAIASAFAAARRATRISPIIALRRM